MVLGTFQLRCKCAWHLGTDLQICVVCRRLMAHQVVVCSSVIYSLFKDTLLMCIYINIFIYICMYIYIMWCWLLSGISAFLSCALLPARVLVCILSFSMSCRCLFGLHVLRLQHLWLMWRCEPGGCCANIRTCTEP